MGLQLEHHFLARRRLEGAHGHQRLLLPVVEVAGGVGDLGGDGQEVVGQHVGRRVHDYGLGEAGEAVHPLGAPLLDVVVDEHEDVAEDFVGQLRCDARDLGTLGVFREEKGR